MKTFILWVGLVFGISAADLTKEEIACRSALVQGITSVKGFKGMSAKQYAEYVKFLDTGIDTKLAYNDGVFYVKQAGKFKVLALKDDGSIDETHMYTYEKITTYAFNPNDNARPYAYVPSIFKLGGAILYNKDSNAVSPDIALMVEVISFDQLFNAYGFGLNISGGLKHVGASLSYQFHKTTFFKNTSLFIGYGYDFIRGGYTPFAGISLNF